MLEKELLGKAKLLLTLIVEKFTVCAVSEIMALGFNEKFIRTWEYYFDYCGAGFKSRTLGTYQVVFSRPGNVTAFIDPYQSWPSAC
ncbi:hypothetical protein Lal_00022200 [Lupinus albus]|nr:hypothetical protein Lal_00022200 [Lupinus albus]